MTAIAKTTADLSSDELEALLLFRSGNEMQQNELLTIAENFLTLRPCAFEYSA